MDSRKIFEFKTRFYEKIINKKILNSEIVGVEPVIKGINNELTAALEKHDKVISRIGTAILKRRKMTNLAFIKILFNSVRYENPFLNDLLTEDEMTKYEQALRTSNRIAADARRHHKDSIFLIASLIYKNK